MSRAQGIRPFFARRTIIPFRGQKMPQGEALDLRKEPAHVASMQRRPPRIALTDFRHLSY